MADKSALDYLKEAYKSKQEEENKALPIDQKAADNASPLQLLKYGYMGLDIPKEDAE